jgi:hypothetical protein
MDSGFAADHQSSAIQAGLALTLNSESFREQAPNVQLLSFPTL